MAFMNRPRLIIAALLGAAAVAAGAFGAHGLEGSVSAERLATWELAARYQLVHSVALLAIGFAGRPGRAWAAAAWLMIVGVVIFAGSLYLLAWTDTGWLGAITPIGGTALIADWFALAFAAFGDRPAP